MYRANGVMSGLRLGFLTPVFGQGFRFAGALPFFIAPPILCSPLDQSTLSRRNAAAPFVRSIDPPPPDSATHILLMAPIL